MGPFEVVKITAWDTEAVVKMVDLGIALFADVTFEGVNLHV